MVQQQQQKKQILNLIAEDIIKSLGQQKTKEVKDYFKQNKDVQKYLQNEQDKNMLIEIIDEKLVIPILKKYAKEFLMTKTVDDKQLSKQKFIQNIKSKKDKIVIQKNKETFDEFVNDFLKIAKSFENYMPKYTQIIKPVKKQNILKKNRNDYKNNADDYFDLHYELLPPKLKKMVDKYDNMSEQQYQKNKKQIAKEVDALSKEHRQIFEKFEVMNELLENIIDDNASQDQLYEYSGLIGQVVQQLQQANKKQQKQTAQANKKKQKPDKKQQKQTPQANKKQQKPDKKQKQTSQANKKQQKQTKNTK